MEEQPLVSIVTPCRNAARFIERSIESVLSQDYPRIEYIVMDGASTDGTVEILERYRGRLEFESAADGGTADAINKGFARSHGSILAWLNADDEYLPGAVGAAVRGLAEHPDAAAVYGEGIWVDEQGREIGRYPTTAPYRPAMLGEECGICQPAAFMRRAAVEAIGGLDRGLHYSFDYDLWIRLSEKCSLAAMPEAIALSRMHRANKTLGGRREVFRETIALLRRHYGYVPVNWVYGYLSFLRDGRDQYFEPLRHSPAVYLASLPVGVVYNWRHPWRYLREWSSRLRIGNLARIWKEGEAWRKNAP